MRLKTSGNNAGGSAAGGGAGAALQGWGWGGGSRGAGGAPVDPVEAEAPAGTGPGLPSLPAVGGGEQGSAAPPRPIVVASHLRSPPGQSRGQATGLFFGLGSCGPNAEEGRPPNALGGAVHQRAARGEELGSAWEARQARPSIEDNPAAPVRRPSGTTTWRPGVTRGRTLGQRGPAEGLVWPSWLA